MPSAKSVAKELVRLSLDGPLPDPPTPYRLHCLLYYAQAWSLVLRDSELFPEEIEAGDAGPVVEAIADNGPVWQVLGPGPFDQEPNLDAEDKALFLRRLWMAASVLSPSGLFTGVHGEAPFLEAKRERNLCGKGLIDMEDIGESFSRRPGVPAPLNASRELRREREKEAELAVLARPPLGAEAICKGCRSVTPSAGKR